MKLTIPSRYLPAAVAAAPEPEPPLSYEEAERQMDEALAAVKAARIGSASREEALKVALKAADDLVRAHRAARASRR